MALIKLKYTAHLEVTPCSGNAYTKFALRRKSARSSKGSFRKYNKVPVRFSQVLSSPDVSRSN